MFAICLKGNGRSPLVFSLLLRVICSFINFLFNFNLSIFSKSYFNSSFQQLFQLIIGFVVISEILNIMIKVLVYFIESAYVNLIWNLPCRVEISNNCPDSLLLSMGRTIVFWDALLQTVLNQTLDQALDQSF